MQALQLNKTKWLFTLAAVILLGGILFDVCSVSTFAARYISEDNILEEGTLTMLRETRVGLLSAGIALAILGTANAAAARRRHLPGATPLPGRLALAAVLCLAAYLIYVPPYYATRLLSVDPAKYAVASYNLFTGRGFILTLNHQPYPADILIGYPLCILPVYLLLGSFAGNAIYATLASSLLAVWVTHACARRLFGAKAALLAALLLSTNWLFVETGREVRSDVLSCLLMVLAVLIFLALIQKTGHWHATALLMGLVLGFSFTVRPPNLVLLAALLPALLIRKGFYPMLKVAFFILLGMSVLIVPYLAFCNATYGAPLRTGYHAWQYKRIEDSAFISPRNIACNIPPPWMPPQPQNAIQRIERFLGTTNGAFYSSMILGLGKAYSPAVFIFIVAGAAGALRGRGAGPVASACILLTVALSVTFYMMMDYHQVRYILPVLPLLLLFAAYGISRKITFSHQERISPSALAYIVLFAIVMSSAGLSIYRRGTGPPPVPHQYELCRTYSDMLPKDGCIISGIDGVLLDHFVLGESERTFFALSDESFYVDQSIRLRPDHPLTHLAVTPAARQLDEIRGLIDGGKVVMMDDWENPYRSGLYGNDLQMMRDTFALEEVARSGPFHIYRLSNRPAGTGGDGDEPRR